MHIEFIKDKNNDVIDANYYCSDYCHQLKSGDNYEGWNGCHETEQSTNCYNCNKEIKEI